ncbi:MAG: 30S ribosomal protein S3 [bacterium]|nr:30S ribosomal protein S3 [bacterium]
MGKKINPVILRINTTAKPLSRWFANKQTFADYLQQDVQLRKMIATHLKDSGVSRIEIKRSSDKVILVIYTSKPGVIIGRSGSGIDELKKRIKKQFFGSEKVKINIEIEEIRQPDLDAALVMQSIAYQLEKRVPFRRAMKRAVDSVMQAGGKGVKVICAGRLNGVEIARTETLVKGSIPTHTLRANLDYSRGAANTIYGKIGIKVWIFKGLVFGDEPEQESKRPRQRNQRKPRPKKQDPDVKKSTRRKKRTIVKGTVKNTEESKKSSPEVVN